MVKSRKPQGELRVRGKQREPLEADLVAQIVLMLGRQLARETMTDVPQASGTGTAVASEEVVS